MARVNSDLIGKTVTNAATELHLNAFVAVLHKLDCIVGPLTICLNTLLISVKRIQVVRQCNS
jgi:hypothetical protein